MDRFNSGGRHRASMRRSLRPMKRALVTGITGQDGSYLAELLLGMGYEVHGLLRRSSNFNTKRIDHLYVDPHEPEARLRLHFADLTDGSRLARLVAQVAPDEVYNLGAQSHVAVSFLQPEYTMDVVALGAMRMLEAVRHAQELLGTTMRYYQAGSSEMFGAAPAPQNEQTRFAPRSPYGVSKVAAHHATVNYREAYGLHACNGILFNHESERRGETFVTRKITRAAGRIAAGLQDTLYLGNLGAERDWGHAEDSMRAAWLMLQQDTPDDYVVATGESHTVQEFLDAAFSRLGLDWQAHVREDPRYLRPAEVDHLRGDASHARATLGWEPKVSFEDLVARMVDHDLALAEAEAR